MIVVIPLNPPFTQAPKTHSETFSSCPSILFMRFVIVGFKSAREILMRQLVCFKHRLGKFLSRMFLSDSLQSCLLLRVYHMIKVYQTMLFGRCGPRPYAAETASAQQQAEAWGQPSPSVARFGSNVFTKRTGYGQGGRTDLT